MYYVVVGWSYACALSRMDANRALGRKIRVSSNTSNERFFALCTFLIGWV